MGPLPFGARLYATTRAERLIIGRGEGPELLELDADGSVARIVRWPDHDRVVTDADMEDFIDAAVEATPEQMRAEFRGLAEGLPRASAEPAYHELIASGDGAIWVGDYPGAAYLQLQTPPPEREWKVFDSTGVLEDVVRTPSGFRPMAISENRLFGVHLDELGVETVHVYELPPGRP